MQSSINASFSTNSSGEELGGFEVVIAQIAAVAAAMGLE